MNKYLRCRYREERKSLIRKMMEAASMNKYIRSSRFYGEYPVTIPGHRVVVSFDQAVTVGQQLIGFYG